MSTQPEAMRLADALTADDFGPLTNEAAAELRRLHEKNRFLVTQLGLAHDGKHRLQDLNADLLEALQSMLTTWEHGSVDEFPIANARAAIAKATGEK